MPDCSMPRIVQRIDGFLIYVGFTVILKTSQCPLISIVLLCSDPLFRAQRSPSP